MNSKNYSHIEETIYSEKLANGLTVLLLPKKEMAKTYGLFTTNYGSIDQTFVPIGEKNKVTVPEGVAHFLEHKLFEKEDRDVFADFGKQGASPNAYTSFTKTAYLFSATDHIEKNVLTLIDFVQDPYFSEQSVEKEKGIIAQEIKMYDDQPDWQAFMGTIKSMFKKHPVNIDIAGTVESIHSITKDDLYMCYNTFYHPENMTLFLAGNFEAGKMMSLIKENQESKQFAKMDDILREFPDEPEHVAKKETYLNMPVSIPKCTVGIKESVRELFGKDYLHKDLLQNMLLSHYFSKSGTFYQELYEQNLIDDSFYFETNLEKNFGYTLIGSNSAEPEKFAAKVKEQLLSTNRIQLTEEEFERMKKKKIGQLLRQMNSLEFIANQYTQYHMLDIDFFEVIPAIQKLSLEDATQFLRQWITEERIAVCTISAK
ncbi:EF-P 5-aminopentanol modification-associated protein YfmH [Virgibacillus halodenitrificans]|uniref:Peptidase M16 n=1 Tax=Virgibacillus halodenitrificans TaxID=1482 RepID=A0AAC9IZV5_VIRHA|nr:pitrilysin family protein [Virgibacillus halodenitrificans]APC48568.1 peptidase M16 [Virgibacillus halodenitrificans]MCG1028764.1 insulinase family protein [Virgibacillus halodenitrificans]MCJ0931142.1 insulinase family protein [Virgibacillus halodenitrificans]WHX27225.1 pitrilysin family protein [Virgibacillus halodenitrificans]